MFTLNCNGRLLAIDRPLVMGILNCTPDSFYSGSRTSHTTDLIERAGQMIRDGASILDLGGQSTRPGSIRLSQEEERLRVIPAIQVVRHAYPEVFISIDTFYASIAKEAVLAGADLVNDISSGDLDPDMLATVGQLNVPFITMHMKGTPETMQQKAHYDSVELEVMDYFLKKKFECEQAGIKDLIIDPGFGFGKTPQHNLRLLQQLEIFKQFKSPVLVGLSRKSTICRILDIQPDEALNGTTVLNTVALLKGAHILRVHDVKEAKEAIQLTEALKNA